MINLLSILNRKIEFYGNTEAAYDFAIEEFLTKVWEEEHDCVNAEMFEAEHQKLGTDAMSFEKFIETGIAIIEEYKKTLPHLSNRDRE